MRSDFGTRPQFWVTLVDYGASSSVSALTTLLAYSDYGSTYRKLNLFVEFTTAGGRAIGTPSHGGVDPCPSLTKFDDVAAGQEACVILDLSENPATNYSFACQSDSPGVTTASIRWALLALPR